MSRAHCYVWPVCLLLLAATGCGRGSISRPLRTGDEAIIDNALSLVSSELNNLSPDDSIEERYGTFQSITVNEVFRTRASKVFDLRFPATLTVKCNCQFDQYSTPVVLRIVEGDETRASFTLEPAPERLAEHPYDEKVQRQDGVWFLFGEEGGEGSHASHSLLAVEVTDPEFRP